MADQPISGLTELVTPANGDELAIVDIDAGPATTKKITVSNLTSGIPDVALNTTHRTSDGKDHSDVVLNNTHRTSDGKDHSDVVLNNTHRGSTSNPHSTTFTQVVAADAGTDITPAEAETLTDGSNASALHVHTFGSEFHQAADETETSTSSGTYVQKLRLTTSSLPSGNYIIHWQMETRSAANDDIMRVRLEQNDTTELATNTHFMKTQSVNRYHTHQGFKYLSGVSGVNTFDIDALTDNTIFMRRARIVLYRVS